MKKRAYYEQNLLYHCVVCKAHIRASEHDYTRRDKRCEDCYQQDLEAIYPFNTFTDVFNAIMQGKKLTYKIAEGFFMTGQLIDVGIGEHKVKHPAILGPAGGTLSLGEKEVKEGIKRTYPQFWRETHDEKTAK